jgi:hypothetical protein
MPQPFYEREQYSHTGCKRSRFGRRVSEGLAHNAYIVGTAGKAAIIDARVNGDINVETAARNIFTTTHSFETYRNEDNAIGYPALAHRCRAEIFHGAAMDFEEGIWCMTAWIRPASRSGTDMLSFPLTVN